MRLRQLFEATNDSIAFCFGRMNPPTIGHGQVFDTLSKTNKNYRIFISPAQTPKKDNPLEFSTKIKFIKAMFPQHAGRVSDDASLNTIMKIAVTLYNEGYKNITVVAGSDRLESFSKLLNDYNGVESAHGMYKFDNIDLVSSGDRDPDADGLEGISASAARAAAREGDLEKFSQVTGAGNLSEELYKAVRAGLNIKEEAAGVGIVTKQNATVDVPVGGEYMNVKKLFPKKKKVKEQGVAEVSKATIDRYVTKASDAHGDADFKARMSKHDPDKRSYHVDQKKTAEKRRQGISRALDRMSRQESVEEGDNDWSGSQGNFAGDKPFNLGSDVAKRLDVNDTVSYFGEKATILAMSKDRTVSRIDLKSGITQNVKTSDLKRVGQGMGEATSVAVRMQRAADKQRAKSDASLARTPSSIPKKEEPKKS